MSIPDKLRAIQSSVQSKALSKGGLEALWAFNRAHTFMPLHIPRFVRIVKDSVVPAGSLQDVITMHAVFSFATDVGGEISNYRVVTGEPVSDHVTESPRTIVIDGAWTDTPSPFAVGATAFRDAAEGLVRPRVPSTRNLIKLETWKRDGQLCKVVHPSRVYTDMVITSVSRVDDKPSADVRVSIMLQELRTVEAALAPGEIDIEAKALEDLGQVSLTDFQTDKLNREAGLVQSAGGLVP